MSTIAERAVSLYNKNLEFLSQYDNELFSRIMNLSLYIEQGDYVERFHLEYIEEQKQFDIFDQVNNTYVYDKNPIQFIKTSLNNINLDKENTLDFLNPMIYNFPQDLEIDHSLYLYEREQAMYIKDIYQYTKIFNTPTTLSNKKFKYIEKFIFVGTLLGSHIIPIHNKIKSNLYFIYEYNLEIFRLSLFVTDYANLAKESQLIFSIMDDKELLQFKLSKYFHQFIRSNYMAKFYSTNYNIKDFFDVLLIASSHNSPFAYSYKKIIEGIMVPISKNINNYPILDTKYHHLFLKDKPILLLGAGPSLSKNIQWIKENQSHYLIVAVGAVITILCDHDITPDLIITVDPDDIITKQFPSSIHDKIKNIPLLASLNTYYKILEFFNKENVILYETMTTYKQTSDQLFGYSIGEISLNILIQLGANNIYMLGTDLALDQETGQTHVSSHDECNAFDISEEMQEHNSFIKKGSFNVSHSTLVVKGNLTEQVMTTIKMEKSIFAYNKSIERLLINYPNIKIYNLSNGAYINHTIPLDITTIKPSQYNKQSFTIEFLNYLHEHTSIHLTKSESNDLLNSIKSIDNLIDKLNLLNTIPTNSYDEFLIQREEILIFITKELKKYKQFYLDRLFIYYISAIEPFLGYQFNSILTNEKELINQVKNVWITHMLTLAEEYKSYNLNIINKKR